MSKRFYSLRGRQWLSLPVIIVLVSACTLARAQSRYRKPYPPGMPNEVQITPYKTTMIANGRDKAVINVKIIDSRGDSLPKVNMPVTYKLTGDAHIISVSDLNGSHPADLSDAKKTDSTWQVMLHGNAKVVLQAGRTRSTVMFEASADSLWPGGTTIMTVQPGTPHPVTRAKYTPRRIKDKILGADISFLPQMEARGIKFSDNGVTGDPIKIMKAHGFNYIRLRIFVDPANPKGYSPGKGFCDLAHTEQMARRIKAAGMGFLLDFHYSDYWADPQKQFKPLAWEGEGFTALKKSLYDYTVGVMKALKAQGTVPDMVQVGNEINHGMVWPEGQINNLDSLAQLIYAGVRGVRAVSPKTYIMLHIALGGQNPEARFFIGNMLKRNVPFDIIGLSYYPKWHGSPTDLRFNMDDLARRYPQQVMVAEYSQLKKEVNDVAFHVPDGKAVGSFIWEPLNSWEGIFDRNGKANNYLNVVYPEIAKKYLGKK